VTHQPAISFSISIHFPFNRAGGRTSNVRQNMKAAIIIFGSALLVGCASSDRSTTHQPPYDIATFQADVLPLSPEASTDLSDLLLTLPVFEVSPNERRSWVARNRIRSKSGDRLSVGGDGAQCPLTIERMPSAPNSKPRIRVTLEPWDDPAAWRYELQRASNGWILLGTERRQAEQIVAHQPA
jgi:hypothetical protein